jgi:diguanylate cyclase (GGDEF)-like protein
MKGKLCYEVMQGSSTPCEHCTNCKLRSGYFVEWKYYNPKLKKSYSVKDTAVEQGGRRFRVELAIDMTAQEQQKERLQDYINSEAMVNNALQESLAAPTPEASIEKLIEYVGHALQCDRVYIFENKRDGASANTYEWCAEGAEPQKENLQDVPAEATRIWTERFERDQNVIIRDLEMIREKDPLMYEVLKPQDIHSLVVSPLIFNRQIIGFYGVDNPPGTLVENISMLFRILGHFIVALLRRRDLFRGLERLSFCDQLTGLGNRHALLEYIRLMDKDKSVGIIYCDVMGLKKINDSQGHQAGDQLLLRAAQALRRVFSEENLFRIGGDEFMVLCEGISREVLLEKANFLKKNSMDNAALMAMGCVWRQDGREDIEKLVAEADNLMYQDKRKYYEVNHSLTER